MNRNKRTFAWLLAVFSILTLGMGNCVLSFAASTETFKRVVEVRYVGLESITPRDLETLLPFSPGDMWRDSIAELTRQAVTTYYSKRGFYETKVHAYVVPQGANRGEENRLVLMVRVDEGRPCIIRSLWIDDPPGFKSKHVMLRFKDDMADIVHMAAGDRYDEQTLSDHLRELREWLVQKNYILANTDRIRVTYNDDKTSAEVVLAIDYGDRVTFGYRDSTVFSKGELDETISQIRATGLGKDYVGVIQRKFIDEYKSRAYNDIRIDVRSTELPLSKHITFVFNEGLRTEIQDIKWDGISEANAKIAQDVFRKGVARLVQRGFFVEKDFDKGILVVLEDMRARGYLSSKLIAKTVVLVKSPPGTRRVNISVQISEGEQTTVGKISLNGFQHINPEKIAAVLNVTEGKEFNPFALEEGLQKLRSLYLGEGFLSFRVLTPEDSIVAFSENNRLANISLRIDEGPRIKVGTIEIKGLQKTKEFVVIREFAVHPEDWWLASKIQQTEKNIRSLSLFSDFKIVPVQSPKGPGYRNMLIELKEAEPGSLEVGPGFRSDLGLRAFARLSYNNLFGRNWIGSIGGDTNRRFDGQYRFLEYNLDTTFVEPRFFDTHLLYTIGLSTKKQRFPPDFNAVTTEAFTSMERKFFNVFTTKLAYKYQRIRQFDVFINNQLSPDDNRSILIGSLVPSFAIDTRDNTLTASGGFLITGSLEYAHPYLTGQSVFDAGAPGYQKWTGAIHNYLPITKDILWSNVFAGGFERSNIAGREIPLIKLFRLGGYGTIRGFSEDEINYDAQKVYGTLSYLNYRTQIDLPLVGDLKFAPFLDLGNLYKDGLFNQPFFRVGSGVGLHYMTPIGPINLDWGHKLNQLPNESSDQFHFSVGLI